jgi:hypothetical protein
MATTFSSQDFALVRLTIFSLHDSALVCPTISVPRTLLLYDHLQYFSDRTLLLTARLFQFQGHSFCPLDCFRSQDCALVHSLFQFLGLCSCPLDCFHSQDSALVVHSTSSPGLLKDSFNVLLTAPMQELLARLPDCSSSPSAITSYLKNV